MHFPADHSVSFWRHLGLLQSAMDVDDTDFCTLMGITTTEFRRRRSRGASLSLEAVDALLSKINLSYEALQCGDIDLEAVSGYFSGGISVLPQRYRRAAFSRQRASVHILDFVERQFGFNELGWLLRRLQIGIDALDRPDEPVNVLLTRDLCAQLKRRGYHDSLFVEMGRHSAVVTRGTLLGESLSKLRSASESFGFMFERGGIGAFDLNSQYQIYSLTKDKAVIKVRERKEAQDALDIRGFSNPYACLVRMGVASSLPSSWASIQSRRGSTWRGRRTRSCDK